MRRHWMTTALALALGGLLAPAGAQTPPAQPAAPPEQVIDGAVLTPAAELLPDAAPFPSYCPEPCPPPDRCHFYLYSGAYLFQPTFQTNPAFLTGTATTVRQHDFSQHMTFAPLAGLGFYTPSGWGMRSRWYHFDQSASQQAVAGPGETLSAISPLGLTALTGGSAVTANSELQLDSWEVEGTYLLGFNQWTLLLGTGVRYAHIAQDYAAVLRAFDGSLATATSGHNFNGAGPTFSADGRLPLRNGGLALYGISRISVLFGNAREDYSAVVPNGPVNVPQSSFRALPIGELEVGLEYNKYLGRLQRSRFFVQGGFVGQVWWSAGNAANTDPFAHTTANNNNLGLLGVALRAGFNF